MFRPVFVYGETMKIFLLLCIMAALLPLRGKDRPDPYELSPKLRSNIIMFHKPAAERLQLLDAVSLLPRCPADTLEVPRRAINEEITASARSQKKKYILGSPLWNRIQQVRNARNMGFKVLLGPVRNMDELVNALLLAPDGVLLADTMTPERIRQTLQQPLAGLPPPIRPVNWNAPEEFLLNGSTTPPRAAGTVLRVLSYNILAQCWNHRPMIAPRAEGVAAFIHLMDPDIAGLQEVENAWYQALEDKIKPYRFVRMEDPALQGNLTCNLIYHAERFRQTAGGLRPFTDRWIRCFHWARFQHISSGKHFIVTNTHWDLTTAKRLKNADLMAGFIQELQKQYPHDPIICTGDFNSNIRSREFNLFLQKTGMQDTMQTAPRRENADLASYLDLRYFDAPEKKLQIDHITSWGIPPGTARLLLWQEAHFLSDHLPVMTDFR